MENPRFNRCCVTVVATLACSLIACDGSGDIAAFLGVPPDSTESPDQLPPDAAGNDTATIRVVNVSPLAVDVQLFLTTDPTMTNADALLQDVNALRDGIGFLSLGILDVGESADVELDCMDFVFVGTRGGEFLDPVSGDVLATGGQIRWAQLGPQFDCGDRVTFEYFLDDEGNAEVRLRLR